MFKGEIKLTNEYNAVRCLDSIVSLIHNFKNEFDYEIESITTTDDVLVVELSDKIVIALNKSKGVSGYGEVEVSCESTIEKFNEIYKYFNYNLTDYNFKVGDIVYYDRKRGVIKEIIDKNNVIVKFENYKENKEYASWGLRFR